MTNSKRKYDAVILTDARYVNPKKIDWYTENVLKEDGLLKKSLEDRGLQVERVNWDHPQFDWSSTAYIIFRSTWDYFYRFAEFSEWLDRVSKLTKMINPHKTIRWNLDKHYLMDLQSSEIAIPPTLFIEPGDARSLSEICQSSGWENMIMKPAVSGGAWHTYRLNSGNLSDHESIFRKLIKTESMLFQEFQNSVMDIGEIAFMVIGGKYSHAVRKKAKEGDFRVQDDFGGTVHDYTATSTEIEFAERVVSVCDPVPVYARVDVIMDNTGEPCISELELIEPELWFRRYPEAALRFAESFIEYKSIQEKQVL